ncbi:MAG: secondary thiamine-phosphate synthase enzyme YjbQ [Thermoplasmatota archaeon]
MSVYTGEISFDTKGEVDIINITDDVERIVGKSGIAVGLVNCFVGGATGAVSVIEYEPGLLEDFPEMLQRIAPKNIEYAHHRTWDDGNGHSHVRATLIGPEITLPVRKGKMIRGTWQQVIFIELDVRHRSRTIYVTVTGE